jgi:hypothetical protein
MLYFRRSKNDIQNFEALKSGLYVAQARNDLTPAHGRIIWTIDGTDGYIDHRPVGNPKRKI